MITVQDVTKAFGPKKLFEDANVSFAPGNRYGLTGPNGSGKSTFMKILSGDEDSDTGQVFRPKKLGVLKQDHFRYEDNRVIDVVLMGNGPLWAAMSEKESLLAKDSISDEDGVRLAELENIIGEEDGYTAEADAAELLQGLGIEEPWHDQPMRALAGGYKLRVLLAQALFGKPQALLLDEPTNNLDIDYESIILYPGGYDDMVRQKGSVRSRVESENAEKKKKVAQLQDFVARFSAGTRASQVQSRIRQMQKLKLDDLKRSNIAAPFIKFEQKAPSGKQTLTIDGISKTFGGNEVVKPFSALVTRGEKVCVIGKNGVGKSTLVKMLAGETQPDRGHVKWGHQAQVGYLPQDHAGVIRGGTTAFGWLREMEDKLSNEEISGLLGRMLFSGEERMKPTSTLSGGETVRLLMSKLMLFKDNVLILDEPTNHLDLQSIAALGEGLQRYEGTIIIVTHDQQLIAEVGSRIWALHKGDEILDFPGTFDDFIEKHPDIATAHR